MGASLAISTYYNLVSRLKISLSITKLEDPADYNMDFLVMHFSTYISTALLSHSSDFLFYVHSCLSLSRFRLLVLLAFPSLHRCLLSIHLVHWYYLDSTMVQAAKWACALAEVDVEFANGQYCTCKHASWQRSLWAEHCALTWGCMYVDRQTKFSVQCISVGLAPAHPMALR